MEKTKNKKAELIVALDVDTYQGAKKLVDKLFPVVKIFKVGSQLFTDCGPKIVEYIHKKGAGVFLDLKFHDIPNTVANAVRQAARLRVKMLTLQICGGEEMIKAAVAAAKEEGAHLKIKPPLLVGVTVLTSQATQSGQVLELAQLGLRSGLDGVVCSVHEAAVVRKACGKEFVIVTPGIRPKGAEVGDQKRVATPQAAMTAGSNFLVVGRPVVEAKDPLKAAKELMR